MHAKQKFLDIWVDPHAELPDGLSARYKAESAVFTVSKIVYQADDGRDGIWHVAGADADGKPVAATAAEIEDSGSGTSILIFGGARGLRLNCGDGNADLAETHLLLAPEDVLG